MKILQIQGEVRRQSIHNGNLYPVNKAIWIVRYNTTKYYFVSQILKIFYHFIPALAIDMYLKMNGKKPKLLKLYRKVNKFSDVLQFFTTNEWKFGNKNMRKIYQE
jgi:fatty acyl-CoA reductase